MAVSVSRGYQSGFSELTQQIQMSIGIPEINQQIGESIAEINTLNARVYNLESLAQSAATDSNGGGTGGGYGLQGMYFNRATNEQTDGRSGTTNNNSVVNINITSARGSSSDLQSMAQYLMLRKALNF